ncbi:MAG: CBS domain-containing protein [Rubricoccaceae bacterium]|nr:CBS domain-containing protein [Rubricoccaceae bacterium]
MNIPVSVLLKQKGDWVVSIEPDATVFATIARMVEQNVGAIIVSERGELLGIFTERDYLRRIALQGRSSKTCPVREAMTSELVTVTPETTVEECMKLMTDHKIRHLPVLREGHLAGIISIGDCVRQLSEDAQRRVEDLERFVSGSYVN